MKFKSLDSVIQAARDTLHRFPLVLFSAFIGTIASILYTNSDYACQQVTPYLYLPKIIMISSLGLTLFLSLSLYAEEERFSAARQRLWQLMGFMALVIYYLWFPLKPNGAEMYRFFLINLNLHLLVAFAPFILRPGYAQAFWQYNYALFNRITVAITYSVVLYIGLAVAVLITNQLFNFKIDERIYFTLWLTVAGVFNTWFFLGGVPKDIRNLQISETYPQSLKVLAQFIQLPLVTVYLIILYLYMAKIILAWNLPIGWVSSFILGVSIAGILTLLLLYPLRDKSGNAWIKIYTKYFYLALFPLIVLMSVAIGRRIADYGITEERYFVLVFTVWLFIIALRFTLNSRADIRIIPQSLFILIVLGTWGPWSALSVSQGNQLHRLEKILKETGLLSGRQFKKAPENFAFEKRKEISSVVDYLDRTHGLNCLRKIADWKHREPISAHSFIRADLGFEYVYSSRYYPAADQKDWFSYNIERNDVLEIKGFDYFFVMDRWYPNTRPDFDTIRTPHGDIVFNFDRALGKLSFSFSSEEKLTLDIYGLIRSLKENSGLQGYNVPVAKMTLEAENASLKVKIVFGGLGGKFSKDKVVLDSGHAKVFLKLKRD